MSTSIEALLGATRANRLMIFCGAGISMLAPSHAPSWWEIYAAAAQSLTERLHEHFPEIGAPVSPSPLLSPLTTQQLADLVMLRIAPEFTEELRVVDIADPNENHRSIVSIAKGGGLRAVLTTNFDTLIERAAAVNDFRFTVVTPTVTRILPTDQPCLLIKLHGSAIDPAGMIEASWQKAKDVNPALPSAWRPIIADVDLLVVGYSGSDLTFGATRMFFKDILQTNARIWWLHRPGSLPSLPQELASRVVLIEGTLPDFLRILRPGGDFQTPRTGRNAQQALTRLMEKWSKQPLVGPWGAAAFFLSLCDHNPGNELAIELLAQLMRIAKRHTEKLKPGYQLQPNDSGLANFLRGAGMSALNHVQIEDGRQFLLGSLGLLTTSDRALREQGQTGREMDGFIAAGLGNLGLTSLLLGRFDEAISLFLQSMIKAYVAGDISSFLTGLSNVLGYGFELTDVRRCMRLAESALDLAEEHGDIQASIELRSLLALYASERNEIWLAEWWAREAHRLATAVRNSEMTIISSLQIAGCLLRRGDILRGLSLIAEASKPDRGYINRAAIGVNKLLAGMGISQPYQYSIALDPLEVPTLAAQIEAERNRAITMDAVPWEGTPWRVSQSSFIGESDGRALFQIGIDEFIGRSDRATEAGVSLTKWLLDVGLFVDASWTARNVLLNARGDASARAQAHACLAHAYAALGRLNEAKLHFDATPAAFLVARTEVPADVAEHGMWFFIQCGDVETAGQWASRLAAAVVRVENYSGQIRLAIARVGSWGPAMVHVSAILRAVLGGATDSPVAAEGAPDGSRPYRLFLGQREVLEEMDATADEVIMKTKKLIDARQYDQADEELKRLEQVEALSDSQLAAAQVLKFLIFEHERPVEDIERFLNTENAELVSAFSFTAMAAIERLAATEFVRRGEAKRAADRLKYHSWIGALADHSFESASLLAWRAQQNLFSGNLTPYSDRSRDALRVLDFFGLDADRIGSLGRFMSRAAKADTSQSLASGVEEKLAVISDSREADAALLGAALELRKARKLTPMLLVALREIRAMWALRLQRYEDAALHFARLERSFLANLEPEGARHARMGRARSLSRAGRHAEAEALLTRIFDEVDSADWNQRAEVSMALGMAFLRKDQGEDASSSPSLDKALAAFHKALHISAAGSQKRAFARLGIARVLGERGQLDEALDMFDRATSELAQLGHSSAKSLLNIRIDLNKGEWYRLILD